MLSRFSLVAVVGTLCLSMGCGQKNSVSPGSPANNKQLDGKECSNLRDKLTNNIIGQFQNLTDASYAKNDQTLNTFQKSLKEDDTAAGQAARNAYETNKAKPYPRDIKSGENREDYIHSLMDYRKPFAEAFANLGRARGFFVSNVKCPVGYTHFPNQSWWNTMYAEQALGDCHKGQTQINLQEVTYFQTETGGLYECRGNQDDKGFCDSQTGFDQLHSFACTEVNEDVATTAGKIVRVEGYRVCSVLNQSTGFAKRWSPPKSFKIDGKSVSDLVEQAVPSECHP